MPENHDKVTVPERIRWAVEVVDPGPAERVLEIGCGPGVAAALVCARLETGGMVAIDRSPVAVARTASRNAEHVAAGRLEIVQASVEALEVSGMDKAFSVNVNVFWVTRADRALTALRRALREGGELFVLYGGGPTSADRMTPVIAKAMADNGFTDVAVLRSDAGVGVRAVAPGPR